MGPCPILPSRAQGQCSKAMGLGSLGSLGHVQVIRPFARSRDGKESLPSISVAGFTTPPGSLAGSQDASRVPAGCKQSAVWVPAACLQGASRMSTCQQGASRVPRRCNRVPAGCSEPQGSSNMTQNVQGAGASNIFEDVRDKRASHRGKSVIFGMHIQNSRRGIVPGALCCNRQTEDAILMFDK